MTCKHVHLKLQFIAPNTPAWYVCENCGEKFSAHLAQFAITVSAPEPAQ